MISFARGPRRNRQTTRAMSFAVLLTGRIIIMKFQKLHQKIFEILDKTQERDG